MEDTTTFFCIVCKTQLPNDAPKSFRSIQCSYCKQPNPNPSRNEGKVRYSDTEYSQTYDIGLKESSVNKLFVISSLLLGVAALILFYFKNNSYSYIILSSIFTLIPIFSTYFVPAHWEKLTKTCSAMSGDKYVVNYATSGFEICNYILSGIFSCWFFIKYFLNLIHPYDNSNLTFLSVIIGLVFGIGFSWVISTIIKIIAEIAGKLFSKK